MLPYENLDDLVDAVRGLTPNPWMEVIVPAVTGVVGVITGFGLSTWTEKAARKRAQAQAHQTAIEQGRRPAGNALVLHMEWAISTHQAPGVSQKMPGKIDDVVAKFAATGNPRDIQIVGPIRELLVELDLKLQSFRGYGAYGVVWANSDGDIEALRKMTALVAESVGRWVEDKETTQRFGTTITAQVSQLMQRLTPEPIIMPSAEA